MVQQPVEFAATPSGDDVDAHVQRGANPTQRVQRKSPDVTALDIRYHRG
jgi:hypothetical protein